MAIESHLAELERRHRALDEEIAQEMARPSSDELRLAAMKRRKLQLRDVIEKTRAQLLQRTLH